MYSDQMLPNSRSDGGAYSILKKNEPGLLISRFFAATCHEVQISNEGEMEYSHPYILFNLMGGQLHIPHM